MSASLLHQADGVVWDNGYSKKKKSLLSISDTYLIVAFVNLWK